MKTFFVPCYNVRVVVAGIIHGTTIKGEIVAHAVNAKAVDGKERIDHHTCGLGHLGFSKSPVRVGEDLLGQRKIKSHEEGWPIYAVKSDYVLANHMTVCRPTGGALLSWDLKRVVGLGEVIYQGI